MGTLGSGSGVQHVDEGVINGGYSGTSDGSHLSECRTADELRSDTIIAKLDEPAQQVSALGAKHVHHQPFEIKSNDASADEKSSCSRTSLKSLSASTLQMQLRLVHPSTNLQLLPCQLLLLWSFAYGLKLQFGRLMVLRRIDILQSQPHPALVVCLEP